MSNPVNDPHRQWSTHESQPKKEKRTRQVSVVFDHPFESSKEQKGSVDTRAGATVSSFSSSTARLTAKPPEKASAIASSSQTARSSGSGSVGSRLNLTTTEQRTEKLPLLQQSPRSNVLSDVKKQNGKEIPRDKRRSDRHDGLLPTTTASTGGGRPNTVTVDRWDFSVNQSLRMDKFAHGFSRIGIENQAAMLFEMDQRHLLRLLKMFSDVLLDGELLLQRTSGLHGRDAGALKPNSTFGSDVSSSPFTPKLPPPGGRDVKGSRDGSRKASDVIRGGFEHQNVFKGGGNTAMHGLASDMLHAHLQSLKRSDGLKLDDLDADSHDHLLDQYDPETEHIHRLIGIPPAAAISMRYRLSPWRSLLESWITALFEEHRPEAKVLQTAAIPQPAGLSSLDLCWRSTRLPRARSKNLGEDAQIQLFLQCAFRAADMKTLSEQLRVQKELMAVVSGRVMAARVMTTEETFYTRDLSTRTIDVGGGGGGGANGSISGGAVSQHNSSSETPRKVDLRTKALLYDKIVIPSASIPHLVSTAATLYAMIEHLLPLFGPCEGIARLALQEVLHHIWTPAAAQAISGGKKSLYSTTALGPRRAAPCDLALRYVQCTYAHELTQYIPLLVMAKLRTKDKAALRERQNRMIFTTIKGVMKRNMQSLFQHWRSVTKRQQQLRAIVKHLFATTSDSHVIRSAVQRWRVRCHDVAGAVRRTGATSVGSDASGRPTTQPAADGRFGGNRGSQATSPLPTALPSFQRRGSLEAPFSPAATAGGYGGGAGSLLEPMTPVIDLATISSPLLRMTRAGGGGGGAGFGGGGSTIATFGDAITAATSPRAARIDVGLNASLRMQQHPYHVTPSMATSPMSMQMSMRGGQQQQLATSASSWVNIWDPRTPFEKLRRAQLHVAVLHEHVTIRNGMIAKFEYTERQQLQDRLEQLENGIRDYTRAVDDVGKAFRDVMDYMFPLIPSPFPAAPRSPRYALMEEEASSSDFNNTDGPSQYLGEKLDPIDMAALAAAGREFRRSQQRIAAVAGSLESYHHQTVASQQLSVQQGTTIQRAHSLQEAQQEQTLMIYERQERIFRWLTYLSRHDIGACGLRLNRLLQRSCTSGTSLSLSVVSRTTHLLPILRIALLAMAPPCLPHFELTDIFTEELLLEASPVKIPPRVPDRRLSSFKQAVAAQQQQQAIAAQRRQSAAVMFFTGDEDGDDITTQLPELRIDEVSTDRPSRSRAASFSVSVSRHKDGPPVPIGPQTAAISGVFEAFASIDPFDADFMQSASGGGGGGREDGGSSSGKNSANTTPQTSTLLGPLPGVRSRRRSSTSTSSAGASRGGGGERDHPAGGGGRRRSLAEKLQIVTLRAAQMDEMQSGEAFSERYKRKRSLGVLESNTQLHHRKSIEVYRSKSPKSISTLEVAALSMVAEHRKSFLGTTTVDSMFDAEDMELLKQKQEEKNSTPTDASRDMSAKTENDASGRGGSPSGGDNAAARKAKDLNDADIEAAVRREEEEQITAINEELEVASREQEIMDVLRGYLECVDATSFTHLILKLVNRMAFLGGADDNSDETHSLVKSMGLKIGRSGGAVSSSLLEQAIGGGGGGGGLMKIGTAPRVFPHAITRHMVLKDNNWRHLVMAALYFSQIGSTCMAFRNVYTGLEVRSQKPLHQLSPAERREVLLGQKKRKTAQAAAAEIPHHDAVPTSSIMIHQLFAKRKQRRKDLKLDVEEHNALVIYNDSVRDISLKAFYGVGLTTSATQVYDKFCASSPDIACATFILPSFMACKLRIVFGSDSSFWKPVTSMRIIKSAKELEDIVTTLAPLARISPQELCDRLLGSLDDTDMFFSSLSSTETEDAFTACFPEISVVFALYSSGDPLTPTISFDNWMAMNQPLFDANYGLAMAETIFETVSRRLLNLAVQEHAVANGNFSLFSLSQSLQMSNSSRVPAASTSDTSATSPTAGSATATTAAGGDSRLHSVGLDLDSFCDALSVLVSIKFPSPFVPLEQKVVPFVQTLLVPLVGAKSKDMRRKIHGADIQTKKQLNMMKSGGLLALDSLSPDLRMKIKMIRDKQVALQGKRKLHITTNLGDAHNQ